MGVAGEKKEKKGTDPFSFDLVFDLCVFGFLQAHQQDK
jgi:hypothetical protein